MDAKSWKDGDQCVVEILGRVAGMWSAQTLAIKVHKNTSWSDVAVVLEAARDRARELALRDYDARCRHEAPPLERDRSDAQKIDLQRYLYRQ